MPRLENLSDRPRPERDPFALVVGFVIVACACWTVFCHLFVFSGASFASLLRWSFVPVIAAIALAAILRGGRCETSVPSRNDTPADPEFARWCVRLGMAAAIVLAYRLTGNYLLFWGAAMLWLGLTAYRDAPSARSAVCPPIVPAGTLTKWIGIAALGGALLTAVAHRPDWDDATYVGLVARAQAQTERALLGPEVAPQYRVHTYEPLVAALASCSHLSIPFLYYLVLPTMLGFLVVVTQYLAARELGGGKIIAVAMILIALVAWGDDHCCVGNFAFVRLFQGKAAVVSFFVPAILYYVAGYVRAPSARNWSLLALTQIAAVGFSSNALVVAPLSAAVFLIASLRRTRAALRSASVGLLASAYPVVLLVGASASLSGWERVWTVLTDGLMRAASSLPHADAAAGGLHTVLGNGLRAYLALFAVLGLAAAPRRPTTGVSAPHLALALLAIPLNPFIPQLFQAFADSLVWRIFWVVPFPIILGLLAASLAAPRRDGRRRRFGTVAAAAMCAAFAFAPGSWTLSAVNGTRIGFPGYKVDPTYWVADAAIRVTEPGGLILAPEPVAVWIPTFPNPPRTVAIRRMYLDGLPAPERSTCLELFDLVERGPRDRFHFGRALREIRDRHVTTVVVSDEVTPIGALRGSLGRLGYAEYTTAGHQVFVLDPSRGALARSVSHTETDRDSAGPGAIAQSALQAH